jgi:sulfide:quinone oxidoreductase
MNIGQLSERFFITGQITADDLTEIAAQGFRSIVNNRPDGEEPAQPKNEDLARVAAKLGLDYVYIPVVSGQLTQQNVDDFNRVSKDLEGPVLLFCRSGARCTVLWQLSEQRK